jgi:hypothetical protein
MEKFSKKDLLLIYKKCLNLVKRKPPEFFLFKKMRCYQGSCDYTSETLEFDHRKEFIRTAYHECVHYLYPDWSETKVLYVESRLINSISILDTANFLKYISLKLYKSELQKTISKKRKKKTYKKEKK